MESQQEISINSTANMFQTRMQRAIKKAPQSTTDRMVYIWSEEEQSFILDKKIKSNVEELISENEIEILLLSALQCTSVWNTVLAPPRPTLIHVCTFGMVIISLLTMACSLVVYINRPYNAALALVLFASPFFLLCSIIPHFAYSSTVDIRLRERQIAFTQVVLFLNREIFSYKGIKFVVGKYGSYLTATKVKVFRAQMLDNASGILNAEGIDMYKHVYNPIVELTKSYLSDRGDCGSVLGLSILTPELVRSRSNKHKEDSRRMIVDSPLPQIRPSKKKDTRKSSWDSLNSVQEESEENSNDEEQPVQDRNILKPPSPLFDPSILQDRAIQEGVLNNAQKMLKMLRGEGKRNSIPRLDSHPFPILQVRVADTESDKMIEVYRKK